jgi:tRNA pseudouridine55 synthase
MQSGILLIDKPEGVTSFEVVRLVRRRLALRKIGHLGTLDPFATGLLPLCLKEATKLVPYLMPGPKTYRAVVRLGVATDTQDWTGKVVAECQALPAPAEVRRVAAGFEGEIEQVPPMYSALHYQGRRLYQLARRGEVVALPPRKVVVHRLGVEEIDLPRVTLTVTCSQGTYVRTLAHDLGAALGCGGHLAALRRLQVGAFRVEDALALDALNELSPVSPGDETSHGGSGRSQSDAPGAPPGLVGAGPHPRGAGAGPRRPGPGGGGPGPGETRPDAPEPRPGLCPGAGELLTLLLPRPLKRG